MVTAMLSGETQVGISTLTSLGSHVKSGRLRLLAITARERSSTTPNLPTIAESGLPGYSVYQWYGVIAGAKVDRAIVQKLSKAIAEAVHLPDVVKRFASDGATPVGDTPEKFSAHIESEIGKWRNFIRDARLELQ